MTVMSAGLAGDHLIAGDGSGTRMAIWFAIVPLGRNTASSLPSKFADALAQSVDGGIFQLLLVAYLGVGHRLRMPGDGLVFVSL